MVLLDFGRYSGERERDARPGDDCGISAKVTIAKLYSGRSKRTT